LYDAAPGDTVHESDMVLPICDCGVLIVKAGDDGRACTLIDGELEIKVYTPVAVVATTAK
jgi:hypothetical protein